MKGHYHLVNLFYVDGVVRNSYVRCLGVVTRREADELAQRTSGPANGGEWHVYVASADLKEVCDRELVA